MQLAPPEQTAVVHSNLIRSVGGSTFRDCRHRRPIRISGQRGNGFTRASANEYAPIKLGGVLLSKFGCLLTEVYMANGIPKYLNPRHRRGTDLPAACSSEDDPVDQIHYSCSLFQGGGHGAINASRTAPVLRKHKIIICTIYIPCKQKSFTQISYQTLYYIQILLQRSYYELTY